MALPIASALAQPRGRTGGHLLTGSASASASSSAAHAPSNQYVPATGPLGPAKDALAKGDYAEAEKFLKTISGKDRGDALAELARIQTLQGKYAEADATAFPFRQPRWLVNIPATWRDADDDESETAWARATYAAVRPYLSEGGYVNFMGDDEDDDTAAAYGRTIERLQRIKAVYDPDNVFRLNQNIRPAAAPV